MKKSMPLVLASSVALAATGAAIAEFVPGPGQPAPQVNTVAEVKTLPNDSKVLLLGNVVNHISNEDYTFQDETGQIRVEIEYDKWQGRTVTPQTKVYLQGEVDKDGPGEDQIEVEVDALEIQTPPTTSPAPSPQ